MKSIIAATLLIALSLNLPAQNVIRNFSFENVDCNNQPIGWRPQVTRPNAYLIKLNPGGGHEGNCAVSIASNSTYTGEKAVALFNTMIWGNGLAEKDSIKVSAYIKTRNVEEGVASIWMQLNGNGKIIRDINIDKTGISGNTDWTRVEIALPLSPDVISVSLGCKVTGTGEALFDAFRVFAGGKEIE